MDKPTSDKVYVTQIGAICACGNDVPEIGTNLKANRSGIRQAQNFNDSEYVFGEVSLNNGELARTLGISDNLPRTTLLALKAANEALADFPNNKRKGLNGGLFLGTTVGGMDKTEKLYPTHCSPHDYISTHPCGYTSAYLAKYFSINYYNTISTACSSAANAIMLATRMIKAGKLDYALAGGSDALSAFTFNGFNSLLILDKEPCKPFSAERLGLNLGEAAGFLLLVSEKLLKALNSSPLATVQGYANTNDAFHQTASSPDGRGAFAAMKEAIGIAGLETSDIDYINVHGTGTNNNDLTESIAISRLFGQNIPDLSSTKAFTGHCLGAAGAIESVISLLAIDQQEVYANLNFQSPIENVGLTPIKECRSKQVKNVLSNSFGFGGNDSSLVFSACCSHNY